MQLIKQPHWEAYLCPLVPWIVTIDTSHSDPLGFHSSIALRPVVAALAIASANLLKLPRATTSLLRSTPASPSSTAVCTASCSRLVADPYASFNEGISQINAALRARAQQANGRAHSSADSDSDCNLHRAGAVMRFCLSHADRDWQGGLGSESGQPQPEQSVAQPQAQTQTQAGRIGLSQLRY